MNPSQQKGDPLVIVMQLEEIKEKLDLALHALRRLEAAHGLPIAPQGADPGPLTISSPPPPENV
jgi:hypothetical protein